MKRLLAPVLFCLLGALAVAEGPATNHGDDGKPYTTHEVIPNSDLEAIIKKIPKSMYPPKNETFEAKEVRRKASFPWQIENSKGKKITAEAIVISEANAGFRIAGMNNTFVLFVEGIRQKNASGFGAYKKGTRVKIEGEIRTVNLDNRGDEVFIIFSFNNFKVEAVKDDSPASQPTK